MSHAEAPTNRLAETVGYYTHLSMSRTFRLIQLNVRKQSVVLDGLMNDEQIQDATVLAIQEPWAKRTKERLLTTPMYHHQWTKMVPSTWREGRWPIRSILWIHKDVDAEQVAIPSPDMTAAIIRLPERSILVASVYVPGLDAQALQDWIARVRAAGCEICPDWANGALLLVPLTAELAADAQAGTSGRWSS